MEVLFSDAHLLVVNKPAGVPSQPDPTGDPCVVDLLGQPGLTAPHRLDRPVSGALVLTRTPEALRWMSDLFADQHVEKTYLAIVEGCLEGERTLEHHLVHDARAHKARTVAAPQKGSALARLKVKEVTLGHRYTLVEVRPEGGRFHQIRAQLSAAGHPIKGDVKYCARRGEPDRSIALHAHTLRFRHPLSDVLFKVEAPVPATGLWSRLWPAGPGPA